MSGVEQMPADVKLVLRLRRGDKEALREAYVKYKDGMYTVACALLNDAGAAREVLHGAFVSLGAEAPHLDFYSSLKNYLAEYIVNRSAQILQKRMYKVVEVAPAGGRVIELTELGADTTEEKHTAAVIGGLAEVPLPQREAVTLYHHGGLNFRDIARVQQVSVSTAQTRYRYGIEKLKQTLDKRVER